MTKHTTNILFALAASFVAAGAVYQQKEKTYPVIHTRNEWGAKQSGLYGIQELVRYSCLPGETRRLIDSITSVQIDDIQNQVSAGMAADTVKINK